MFNSRFWKRKRAIKKFKRKDIPKLRYGVLHSQMGFSDGVSIVIEQSEEVLIKNLKIPKKNIFYLVGKSKKKSSQIIENELLWDRNKVNRLMINYFGKGYGGCKNEKIENTINKTKKVISDFISKNKIDVLFVHNSSHPINFISSLALSRYYKDSIKHQKKTPKYILWWHDSHLERKMFRNPANDVEEYLLEGVPGYSAEYIIFINKLQFWGARNYFLKLDKRKKGYYEKIAMNNNIIHNTTEAYINSFKELESSKFNNKVKKFIKDFKIKGLFKEKNLKLKDVLFCLQHTRIVERKRIDFALKYCYKLLDRLKKERKYKAMYFFVSGQAGASDGNKKKLIKLNKKLSKKYNSPEFFLVFAEDYEDKTHILFEEYPRIFAKLKGFSTYFSEVEGFGNNLLEVLASGLIPVIYKYPVFKADIEKYNLSVIALDDFEIDDKTIDETMEIIEDDKKRERMVEKNLSILKRKLPHKVMAFKLVQAITKKRLHR